MKRNFFAAMLCLLSAMVGVVCVNGYATEPPAVSERPALNEQHLKESVLARVGSLLRDNGKDVGALSENAIRIDKSEAVTVQGLTLYAVKLSLQNPEQKDGPRDEMTLLTEPSGTVQFGMVADIATGMEAALSQATSITRMDLSEQLSSPLLTGTGAHEVVFISDPFCPYCRSAYSYLMTKREHIASLRLAHMPLPMHPGADAAAWVMEHALELNNPSLPVEDVVRFAYTDLRTPDGAANPQSAPVSVEDAQKAVVAQFLDRFPQLAPNADAETYTFFLKGKFAARTLGVISELQKHRISGTPAIIIDGQPVYGFDRQAIDARLRVVTPAPEKTAH